MATPTSPTTSGARKWVMRSVPTRPISRDPTLEPMVQIAPMQTALLGEFGQGDDYDYHAAPTGRRPVGRFRLRLTGTIARPLGSLARRPTLPL